MGMCCDLRSRCSVNIVTAGWRPCWTLYFPLSSVRGADWLMALLRQWNACSFYLLHSDKSRDYDFLSSIEVFIMDQTDVFLMQNWEHVQVGISATVHDIPFVSHLADINWRTNLRFRISDPPPPPPPGFWTTGGCNVKNADQWKWRQHSPAFPQHVFDHLHLQPREAHDVDFSRVRMWCLNGW